LAFEKIKKFAAKLTGFTIPKAVATMAMLVLPIWYGDNRWYLDLLNIILAAEVGALGLHPMIIWIRNKSGDLSGQLLLFSLLLSISVFIISDSSIRVDYVIAVTAILIIKYYGSIYHSKGRFFIASSLISLAPILLSIMVVSSKNPYLLLIPFLVFSILLFKSFKLTWNVENLKDQAGFILNIIPQMLYSWLFRGGVLIILLTFGINLNASDYQIVVRLISIISMPAIIINQVLINEKTSQDIGSYSWNEVLKESFLVSISIIVLSYISISIFEMGTKIPYFLVLIICLSNSLSLSVGTVFNQHKSSFSWKVYAIALFVIVLILSFLQNINIRVILEGFATSSVLIMVLFYKLYYDRRLRHN
jgi:hypothetical protein